MKEYMSWYATLELQKAKANALRDALRGMCGQFFAGDDSMCHAGLVHRDQCRRCSVIDAGNAALAQTPAASLAAHDAEVLERAAVKCDEIVRGHSPENARVGTGRRHETKMLAAGAKMCAGAIRALAAQEVKP